MTEPNDTRGPAELMPIGRFSSLTRISVRMLRHYDEHGVLTPADVDAASGYRRYAAHQVADALAIRRLRDLGLSVSAIAAVLAARGTPAYERALRLHRDVVAEEADVAARRLELLDSMLTDLTEENTMNAIAVSVVDLDAETLAALRGTVPTYADEGQLWARFEPAARAQGLTPIGPGGCIEHDDEYRESDVDESVFIVVAPGSQVRAPLEELRFGPRRVAAARVSGPYAEEIPRAHDAIASYLAEHGLRSAWTADDPATHAFNRYLSMPGEGDPVTEVCVPLA